MPGSPSIWFATSNDHKFEEARFVLRESGIVLLRLLSKGPELQSGDPSEVAAHAAVGVYQTSLKPLFVEDTGLLSSPSGASPEPVPLLPSRLWGWRGS